MRTQCHHSISAGLGFEDRLRINPSEWMWSMYIYIHIYIYTQTYIHMIIFILISLMESSEYTMEGIVMDIDMKALIVLSE